MEISIIAITISVVSAFIAFFSYVDNHKHKRYSETLKVIMEWDGEALRYARGALTQLKDFHDVVLPEAIPVNDIFELRKTEFEEGEPITISDHIITLLNYMDNVAAGIKYGIYEDRMIKEQLSQPFKRIYFALEEFRALYNNERIRYVDPWPELSKRLEIWGEKKKDNPPSKPI